MAQVMRDPEGRIWEERGGKWYEVTGSRAGGMLAAQGMGLGEKLLVGAGREFERLGHGIGALIGTDKDRERIGAAEKEASERIEGSKEAGAGAIGLGEMLPGLATLPLGMGVGGMVARSLGRTATEGLASRLGVNAANVAPAGLRGLGEQALISGAMGGAGYSGDQGMDAMAGALLAAGGWGTGQLAGKVVGMIRERGAVTRAAMAESGMGGGGGGAGVVGGSSGEAAGAGGGPMHLGQAAGGNVGAQVAAGVPLPGMVAGGGGLSEEGARLMERGKELKMQFTPGQETGSLPQLQMEASAKSIPWASRAFEPLMRNNEEVLNKTAVRALGERGEQVTQQVLNSAHVRLGDVFRDVGDAIGTVRGGPLDDASARIEGVLARAGSGAEVTPEVAASAKKLLNAWKEGQVTGERLVSERSALSQLSRDYFEQGKGLAGQGVRDLVNVIDDLMERAVPGGERAAMRESLREARGQWRILTALESGASLRPDGSVRAGSLYKALERQFPLEMRRGNFESEFGKTKTGQAGRDLMDVVRITQNFRDVVSDSGTATRASLLGIRDFRQALEQMAIAAGSKVYLRGGGILAHELAQAGNAVPGLGGVGGGAARGFSGGLMGF